MNHTFCKSEDRCCKRKNAFIIMLFLFINIGSFNAWSQLSAPALQSQMEAAPILGTRNQATAPLNAFCLPPPCTISGSNTICPGSPTLLCAPVGMSSYLWSTGETTQCISVTVPGTYLVTVSSFGGCTSTCNTTVGTVSCSITGNTSICSGGSTQLCAMSGGSSYLWSNGATTQCITVSQAGTYSVTVCINGCFITCSKTVTVTNVSCSISGNSTICSNGGSTQLCAPSGMASYLWSTGSTSRCITVTSAGTYSVTVSNGSCTSSCSKTVTVSPPLNCNISGNTSICQGGSTQLCLPSGYQSYSWNTGATTRCITVNSAGTYYGNVNDGVCNTTCHVTVTVNSLSCSITGSSTICPGGSTQLCAPTGMSSYLWSTGATTQCINVSSAGTYTVAISSNGCTSTCSKTVSMGSISCSITGSIKVCNSGTTQLCAPSGMSSYAWNTGATTECITVGTTGTYTVTVSNGSCTSSCSKTVNVYPPLNCTISGNTSICPGGSTQLCLPSGYQSYSWNTGATTRCITVTSPGTYYGNVNDGTCNTTCHVTVTQTNVSCSITGSSSICQGGSTQLCAPAGQSAYLWSNGATTQCINVNTAGSYSVTVTNGSCTSSCSKTVTVGSPNCTISGNLNFCSGGSTQLCAPVGQDSYLWSTGATTQCLNVNAAGNYSVTVTSGSCTSSCSVVVTSGSTPNCTITGSPTCCSGGTTELCAPAGMSSYLWSTGATTQCITVGPGTYSVTVTNGSCTSTCSKTVTVSNPPVCTITGNCNFCPGGSTTLCAPAGMSSYLWTTGETTQCITVSTGGTYCVTITKNGCTSTCSVVVTVTQNPPCTITGNTLLCQGGSTLLCAASSQGTYLWNTGATTQCISVNAAGTYSVVITNGSCTSSCSVLVTSGNMPTCTISGNPSVCFGGTTQLCAPAGMTSYLWSTGETTQCITVGAGTYSVTVSNGSCTSTCSKSVASVNPPPCSIAGNLNICPGGSTQLCAPSGMSSYQWSTGATTQCITVNSAGSYSVTITNSGCVNTCSVIVNVTGPPNCTITEVSHDCNTGTSQLCAPPNMDSYLWSNGATTRCVTVSSGTYSVTVSSGNCTSSCSKTVNPPTLPSCNISGSNFICSGGSTLLCAPAGNASYLWSTGATTQCITVNSAAIYTVIVTNQEGCSSACSKAVFVNQPPSCSITGNSTICPGGSSQLCATPGIASYLWSTGETTECITVTSAATYTVILTDAHGCTSTCSKTVTVGSQSCTITGNSSLCSGSASLCGPAGAAAYVWSTGATTQCITVTSAGTYTLTATSASGCSSTCSKVVAGAPTCSINGCSTLSPGNPATLCVPTQAVSYLWSTGATTQCISVSTPGTYSVAVTDANGCTTTCSQTETIQMCYSSPSNPVVNANQSWTINTTNQTVTIRTTFAKTFVDNTYGSNAIGWSNGHGFNNLVGSDHVQLSLYDVNNVRKLEFKIDYITASSSVPSGYKTLGVSGGDGGMVFGNSSDIVSVKTSLDANFNDFGYVLTSNSPATNANYTPNATYPNWIFDVWYEVTVKLSAFPAGFGRPLITDVHASPSKTGHNTEIVVDTPCTPCLSPLLLGDLVWFDKNNNGLKDANENGLANYTVKLYLDANNDNVPDGPAMATTTTNANGLYLFSGLLPNHYIVGVVMHTGDSLVTINGGDPDNDINNDNNGLFIINNEMRSNAVTLNWGSEPTNDGDGSDGNLSVDFAIHKSTPENEQCYIGVSHHYVTATQTWTINTAVNQATIRTTFSKNFVDNTYGSNAINWPNGHSFNNLVGSDKLQMALYDVNNVKRLEFKLDYISSSSSAPSGYKTLGVSGGDGGMITGNASSIISVKTSLDENLNTFGYVLTSNSPATNTSYAPNASYPNWIYDVWYEVTVDLNAFPAGFGKPVITEIHASPSKTGSNTEELNDTICVPLRMAAPHVSGFDEMTVKAYPNPFSSSTTIEFGRDANSAQVELNIYTLAGKKVRTLYKGILDAGVTYKAEFKADDLPDGVYIYRLESDEGITNGRLVLMK